MKWLALAPILAGLMGWGLLQPNQLHLPAQQQVETRLPKLGVHTRLTDEVEQPKIQRTLEMVREMGAAWDVEYFPWNYIQRNGRDDWNWSHADLVVNHAQRQGLRLSGRHGLLPPAGARDHRRSACRPGRFGSVATPGCTR